MSELLSFYDSIPISLLTPVFFGLLFIFILLGVPLTFVLGGLSVIFIYLEFLADPKSDGLYLLASKAWDLMETSSLIAIPLYVFMAMVLERSGVAHDLYRMMHLWWGGIKRRTGDWDGADLHDFRGDVRYFRRRGGDHGDYRPAANAVAWL